VQANIGTILITTALFTFFYKVMPNTKVHWRGALLSGFLVALASEFAKLAYTKYTGKALFYNKMYGGLAALPLFLIWIYLNWMIFLAGTQLNFFLQNRRSLLEKGHV
jgi:membrane protein